MPKIMKLCLHLLSYRMQRKLWPLFSDTVYIDRLLSAQSWEWAWLSYWPHMFVGRPILAYADDLILLAPTPHAMRSMLQCCEEHAKEYMMCYLGLMLISLSAYRVAQKWHHFCMPYKFIKY